MSFIVFQEIILHLIVRFVHKSAPLLPVAYIRIPVPLGNIRVIPVKMSDSACNLLCSLGNPTFYPPAFYFYKTDRICCIEHSIADLII